MGKTKTAKELAKAILNKLAPTAEDAVALTGKPREEYLKALEVVHGPKDARAKALGFKDNKIWYHGSGADIIQFQDDFLGKTTGAASARKGHFVASMPKTAQEYAELSASRIRGETGNQFKLGKFEKQWNNANAKKEVVSKRLDELSKLRSGSLEDKKQLALENLEYAKSKLENSSSAYQKQMNQLSVDTHTNKLKLIEEVEKDPELLTTKFEALENDYLKLDEKANFLWKEAQKLPENIPGKAGEAIYPLKVRMDNPLVADFKKSSYRENTYNDLLKQAKAEGADSALFKNTSDSMHGGIEDIGVVFDPSQIRSPWAAFDPRFKNSPLVMAGAAGAALTLGGQQEAEAGTLKNLGKVMVKDTAKPLGKTIVVNEGQNAAQAIQKANATPLPQGTDSIAEYIAKHKKPAAAAFAAPAGIPDASPLPMLKQAAEFYSEKIRGPIVDAIHNQLFPTGQDIQGNVIQTSSPLSKPMVGLGFDAATGLNPIGDAAQTVEMLGDMAPAKGYAHGGVVRGYADGGVVEPEFDVFDISGPTPVLGSVPASQVQAAIESGRFALPVNKPVPVMNPDGELGEIPADQAAEAFKQGFKFATPDMERFSSRPVAAGALGAVQGVTAGLAGAGLGALGEAMPGSILSTRDDLNKLEQYNPGAYTAGEVAGTVGSMVLPTGVGGLALRAGRAAEAAIGATTAVGRVGSAATKAAVENMVLASGNETAKIFMGKPDLSVETALSNIGFAGAIGGGIGGAFGAVPELWKVAKGNKLASMLNGVKAATEGKPTAELTKLDIAVAPELEAALSDSPVAQRTFQELMQSDSSSAKELTAMAAKFSDDLSDSAARVIGRTADDVAALSTAETGTAIKETLERNLLSRYEPIAKSYEALEAKFGTAPLMPEVRDSMSGQLQQIVVNDGLLKSKAAAPLFKLVVETMEDLPKQANAQDLRLLAQNLREANPFGSPGYQVAKKVNSVLNSGMDNTLMGAAGAEGAEAAAMFKATQAEYRALKGTIEDLNDYLHAGKARGTQSFVQAIKGMDPETVARRLSQEKTQLVDLLSEQFPEIGAAVKQYSYDKLLKASISEGKLNIRSLAKRIEKMEPETRAKLFTPKQLDKLAAIRTLQDKIPKNMNPSGTAKTIEAIMSRQAATLAGAIMGGMGGGLGALAASLGLKEVKDSFKMGMLRFLASDAPTNAAALKQAMGMATAVEKGQRALDVSVKNVFSIHRGPIKNIDTTKLKELVEEVTEDESRLLNVGGELGHYLPDQAAALGMATVRNIRYLAAQRPSTAPLSPLDGMRQVSDADEAKYERALEIAQQPLIVLEGVKEGRINPQDLQHLAQMYPALRAQMGDKLQTELIEAIGRGQTIPYATKIGLSAFLGQPLESSLQPQAIQAAQPQPATMPQPQGKPARKSNSLPKLPISYQTPGQSRSRARLER